jgi:very-short-patch-repair endonuclease
MDLRNAYRYAGDAGDAGDHRLAALASSQHGIVASWQLKEMGYTRPAIARRAQTGRLRRLHRGVYAIGGARLSLRGHWMAAVLACGSGAVLSHYAAAALWDLQRAPGTRIDVTAAGKHEVQGVRCHVARSLSDEDRTTIDGIPVTSLTRTALDLAELLPPQRLRSTLEAAQRRDLLDMRSLDALIVRSRGHRGVKPLKAALAQLHDEAPWTQSELERRFLELIRSAGLGEPSVNVVVAGELVDFHWPQSRLVVEVDGYANHNGHRSFEEDRRRDTQLQLAGERVIRVTHRQMEHAARSLVADLRRLLGSTAA